LRKKGSPLKKDIDIETATPNKKGILQKSAMVAIVGIMLGMIVMWFSPIDTLFVVGFFLFAGGFVIMIVIVMWGVAGSLSGFMESNAK